MKNIFTSIGVVILTATVFAQVPQKMSYQAVVRNSSNTLLTSTALGMRISILQNTTPVYVETQTPTTNTNGLVTIEIGGGIVISGIFAVINWANGPYFIKTEIDPAGGTNYTIAGTSQLLSVPFALHAKTAENITGNITETDPVFVTSPANGITSTGIFNWNMAYGWGNHASAGYLTSFTETDPIFFASPAKGITSTNILNWNSAYSWGNHATAGYLTSYTENDPAWVTASASYYTKINMQTSGSSQLHFDNLISKPLTLSGYGITDAMNTSHIANAITATNFSNWNTAYGWGDHAGLYLPVSWVPAWTDVTGKPSFATVATSGSYSDLSNKPANVSTFTNDAGYLTSFTETDGSVSNEIQALSISNDTVYLSNGGFVKLPAGFDGDYNSLTNKPGNVSTFTNDAGYLTTEVDGSVLNEIQTLSIHNDTIALSLNGGNVRLPNVVSNVEIIQDSLFITYTNGQTTKAGYVGNGSPGSSLSSVVTLNVTGISYNNVSVNANITYNGNEFIITRGVCLSRNPTPDLNDTVYFSGTGSGSFMTNCMQLSPNTTYYVLAFATNVVGTTYGNELSFITKALTVPTINTRVISNITNSAAISGGDITDDGGTPILVRGLCWSLNSNPTTADNIVTEGVGAGSYIALMTGLTSNTLYHVRAYASNAQGTSYGDDLSLTTIILQLASISTTTASSISYTSAMSGGNVSNDNGSSVTSRGICWASTTSPTTSNSNFTQAGGLGTFTANMTGLTANTTYYVRAFAVNGGGISYGNQVNFTTLATSTPLLTTKAISGISSNLAGSGGVISTDGGSAITEKGVCWGINPTPTIANSKTTDGTGTASYNSMMTGLNPLTLYYVRAYASNGLGTVYGNQVSFTTTDLVNPGPTVPVLGTSSSTITGSSTASSGGYVSSDGGSAVTVRGVCWSTTTNPTLANNFSTDGGTGMGYFTSTITGLSGCGTIYYIRAYATNSTGTGYGNQNTVSTGLMSTITTDDVTNISYYTAVSGGSVTDDGGCPITQKGVCWNYTPNPTTSNSKTTEGAGSSAFVSNITGLYANRTYYVRAYATNSVGTVYGPEKVFVTATPSTLYIGQNYAGGIIFYLDGTGLHGLVCTTSNQGSYTWGCQGTSIPTGTAFGEGANYTATIVASCSTADIAAKICDNLVLNGYSDWFLPSRDELSLAYTNLQTKGLGDFSYEYWTSSQGDANVSGTLNFGNGSYYGSPKQWNMRVRAVRAF